MREETVKLNAEKFGLDKDKAAALSDKQTEKFFDMDSVLNSVDRIEEFRKSVATGPLAGRVQTFAQLADASPREFNIIKGETTNTLAAYVKSISGAQVSELEAQRLKGIIPDVNDPPNVFEDKLRTFERIVRDNKKAFAAAIISGQPLKTGTIKGLLEAESKFKAVKGVPTEKDIDKMTKEELKAYLGEK